MNDANLSACRFSSDILPYMYGELHGPETSVFESHLLECIECTDEFAALSGARYEVYEWKKLAFDPLATPRFEIPFERGGANISSVPFIDRIRALFAAGWVAPALALGAVVVVSLFAGSSILQNLNRVDPAVTTPDVAVADEQTALPALPERSESINEKDRVAAHRTAKAAVVRASLPDRIERRRTVRTSRAPQLHGLSIKAASARNRQIAPPRLDEFVDDDDKSLRLAELFDDIETSE